MPVMHGYFASSALRTPTGPAASSAAFYGLRKRHATAKGAAYFRRGANDWFGNDDAVGRWITM